ncbi:unnamed protein product [Rotaria socialis]|uniref:TTF-type domain-containing protein n=1 Tax=Rotaria socialis TaxID=392032 RepID=A0A818NZ35_9BILA|nr:unnamed protein product [Rotaria socialis]CAF3406397.1 unnamed protein product [Rotaria socialis]CAF3520557.1 unnamed protein product [Rotaria socialis]CAF3614015.1 unnamed protein product [Rotaria socialis]CAF3784414.1 unnamed protein product [Rotaria socialis]
MLWDSKIVKEESSMMFGNMNHGEQFQSATTADKLFLDRYQADLQSMVDSYITSVDSLSSIRPSSIKTRRIISPLKYQRHVNANSSSSLVTFDRDPASTITTEHLTDELRWLLIQYGPHQPRDDEDKFLASATSTNNRRGTIRFRSKWFDDPRFSDWLEYSLSAGRAYCFYCRLFAESNRNRAFSRDGIKNWRKCLGSRGQIKRRSTGASMRPDENLVISQRRGLLESHAMSEAHKQAYNKYLAFVDQMNFVTEPSESKQSGDSIHQINHGEETNQETNM